MVKISIIGVVTLVSIILYAILMTILEIIVILFHHAFVDHFDLQRRGNGISEADLIYHAIFILSLAFQILLCVDALWRRNSIQLSALVLFNLLSLAYAGVQLYQHMQLEEEGTEGANFKNQAYNDDPLVKQRVKDEFIKKIRPIEYTIIGTVSVFSLYLAALSYKLMKEFGWDIYRTYNADVETRNAFRSLSILQTLIKLDVFFIGGYAIQLIPSQAIEYHSNMAETVLIFIIGAIMLLMAWYSITRESKYILLCVINILILSVVYMAFRLININMPPPKGVYDPYEFTRRLLTFFLATTICLVLATIYYAIICFRNLMHGIYIFTVYGLPGQKAPSIQQQQQQQPPKPPVQQNRFNPEYLGYDGYSGSGYTGSGGGSDGGGAGYNAGGHNADGYNAGGYNAGGNNSGGYNAGGNNAGGYNAGGYNGNGQNASLIPDEQNKKSKRASKLAEVQKARLSRRLSID